MLFQGQNHRVIALWAFDFALESIIRIEEKYPEERRPREALKAAQNWAAGNNKMRLAQRKILDCHAFAKEIECGYCCLSFPRAGMRSCAYRWTCNRLFNL